MGLDFILDKYECKLFNLSRFSDQIDASNWSLASINKRSCGIGSMESPTIIYEDNTACVAQMDTGYIKSNITKYIAPKLFYPHQLKQNGEIDILQIKSCDNLADLFTKSLPILIFQKLIRGIGMRRLQDLQNLGGESN